MDTLEVTVMVVLEVAHLPANTERLDKEEVSDLEEVLVEAVDLDSDHHLLNMVLHLVNLAVLLVASSVVCI